MRMGVIGRAAEAEQDLHQAIELFLADPLLKQILYLGEDDAISRAVGQFSHERLSEERFLARAVGLACHGNADELDELLEADRQAQRVSLLRCLPPKPACAIEMLEKWIILGVHDKAVLEEDDVANAHVILYGEAPEANIKRFGPRSFLTPGPLDKGLVGSVSLHADGGLELSLLDLQGRVLVTELVAPALAKLVVAS
jgi:hypothetical protein